MNLEASKMVQIDRLQDERNAMKIGGDIRFEIPRKIRGSDVMVKKTLAGEVKYVTVKFLATRYSVSVPTIWRWAADGRIPKSVQLSPGVTRWVLADLEKWEASRESSRD